MEKIWRNLLVVQIAGAEPGHIKPFGLKPAFISKPTTKVIIKQMT
jgi:hypothetical protein